MQGIFKNFDFSFNKERTILLICIGIAFLIWIFLKLSKDYETIRQVHIEYELPAMMEFTSAPPSTLRATVTGVGIDLAKKYLTQPSPSILLDLTEYPTSEIERSELLFKIQEELKLGVRDIDLNYIRFYIDSTATKRVPVILNADLNFKDDFFLKSPVSLSEDTVTIAGPMQELMKIDSLKTAFVNFELLDGDVTKSAKIDLEGRGNIEVYPNEVLVNIAVEQYTEKELAIPVRVVNAKDSIQVLPSTVLVKCAVGISKYDSLTSNKFIVEADLGEVIKLGDQKSVPVTLKSSPEWVKSPRISPKVVDYLIVK